MSRGRMQIEGQIFSKLTVESFAYMKNNRTYWYCVCECGTKSIVSGNNLRGGKVRSCGCNAGKNNIVHGHSIGGVRDLYYETYTGMLRRCYNINNKHYKCYGGRGITVCDRWLGKEGLVNFINDMGERPVDKTSIDRIDNNGNYCKENCRWATQKEQANNKNTNRLFIFCGNIYTMKQLCEKFNLKYNNVYAKLNTSNRSACEAFGQLVLPYTRENI